MDTEITTALLKLVVPEIIKKGGPLTKEGYNKLKAKIANACHKYDREYRDRHGELKAYCTGMREPIQLDDVYVAVQFLDDSASRYGSPKDIEEAFRERYRGRFILSDDDRKDGTVVANEKQYLMLLGGPGVGKSTFLRKVGLEALKGKNGSFEHKCIPVFLELKRFTADQINIETLITEEFRTCGFPDPEQMTERTLKSGKLLILFDGLDEVPDANVDNVVREIGDFVDQYSKNRFIASCRIAAYKGGFKRFTEVEMAAFDDAQIETYIKNWFDSTPDDYRRQLDTEMKTAQKCWDTLNTIVHQATKELARNPLLLTLLCMVYDNSQNFPRNRADLYEKALSIFLEEWAAEKRIGREKSISQYLDIADEKRMLSEIAAKNFDENRLFFSKVELINQIQAFGAGNANTLETFNAPKILETILIDQGLFVERVRGSYSFSHLTFQEYLTANYIVGDPQSIQGLVNQHLHDPQWREIFLLTAGLMREADDLLEAMEVEAAKSINTDGIKSLFQWAERQTDTTDDRYKGIVKRLFILRQFFSLLLLNKNYEVFENIVNHALDRDLTVARYLAVARDIARYLAVARDFDRFIAFDRDLAFDRYLAVDLNLAFDRDLALDRYIVADQCIVADLYLTFDRDLALALDQYLAVNQYLAFDLYLYQDFYKYMDTDFYRSVSSESKNRFDKQLQKQITFVKGMKELKIFKQVNLQRMVQRLNEQQEFIKAAAAGKSVEPPAKSIHDTWLSVLGITDDMLAIPREALGAYATYLEAVELIIACKEAAGRVSPEVWQQIEDRFLTVDAAGIKN